MPEVLLVSMPYAALDRPALGLGLLQARLRESGIGCETRYLAFSFADFIGLEDYLWVSGELPYTAFAGDWVFTEALYGSRPEADAEYVQRVLREEWRVDQAAIDRLLRVRARCEPYLDHCMAAVPWEEYDVVGFTSTFEQNVASLALARRLKAAWPRLAIVFGGANWEGEMGRELHRQFGFVDFVCSGEADESFPALVRSISGGGEGLESIRGIVHRRGGRTRATGAAPLVRDLDGLPFPDFDPYFRDLAASPAAMHVTPAMLVETSRGCWWGAKSHCTFCGLNGGAMAFRSKTAERALAEIRYLRDRHGTEAFSVVDNILDMGYFRTLLPMLADETPQVALFYEVKANLSQEQVALLAAAGVRRIQPGLESMGDPVLKLMRKGTTMLQNVQLLKWCREHGVLPEWNMLYGFPGERSEDYAAMHTLLDAIWFLDPPSGYGPVRLDRFSPYHGDPAGHGMVSVRPMAPYRYLYPFPHDALMRIAYYFDYDYADGRDPGSYAGGLVEKVRAWMDDRDRGGLWQLDRGDGTLVLVDDRQPGRRLSLELRGWAARAYAACDAVQSLRALLRRPELDGVAPRLLEAFLARCVSKRLMLRSGDRYLALAVRTPARSWTPPPAEPPVEALAGQRESG
jgi:ribosomal peptide maturation radical SAM protein 1